MLSLIFAGILTAVGASALYMLQNKYRTITQAASWQEALLSSESGVELAMNEVRKELYDPQSAWSGWHNPEGTETGTTGSPGATSSPLSFTSTVLLRRGEGGNRSWSTVTVDKPPFLRDSSGEQWYRIRSMGVAEVSGSPIAAGEKADLRLRKLSLHTNRRTGQRMQKPQATRLIEAIARPVGAFRVALFGLSTIDLNNQNVVVDSYDSRSPSKSTNGSYDPAKRQEHGDVATNGTLLDAGQAHVYGDAATNGGTVLNADNVTGEIRNDFFQEVLTVRPPNTSPDAGTPAYIRGSATIIAKAGEPAHLTLSTIQLSNSEVLEISGASDGSPTYCEITVTGDISLSGNSSLRVGPGVHLRVFVIGNMDASGSGIVNSNSPDHLQVYGCDRPPNADGTSSPRGSFKIAGNGGFSGCVYAPNYDIKMVGGGGSGDIYGAIVGNTVSMTGVQSIHYDEALADRGLISDYKVVSWFEDTR